MGDYELKKILEGSFNVYKDAILDVAVRSIKEHEYKTSQKASCEGCVSREAVKDWLELWNGYLDEDMITRMKYKVDCIPGVQQNTDVLDKVREEVEGLKVCVALDEEGEFWYRDALNDAIEIIDKYIDRGMRGVI